MGIFSRKTSAVFAVANGTAPVAPTMPLTIASPWAPTDSLTQLAFDSMVTSPGAVKMMTRDIALQVPGVARAHGIHCTMFAEQPFFEMDGDARTADQPEWLTNSRSGVSPFHRMYGLGSDLFFNGWGCLGFTADLTDCMHIPFGMWTVENDGSITVNDLIPVAYRAYPVAIPLGYGENGLLTNGVATLRAARQIEAAYTDRLNNPIPLTILSIPQQMWDQWTLEERKEFRQQWLNGRKAANGSVAMKPDSVGIDMPGQASVDLFENGRNANRLDIANHTSTPASLLEGVRQGGSGGGTDIRYSGVANGAARNELWDYGLAKRFTLAVEARLSLDDICAPGLSIRADLSAFMAVPNPTTNPTSED